MRPTHPGPDEGGSMRTTYHRVAWARRSEFMSVSESVSVEETIDDGIRASPHQPSSGSTKPSRLVPPLPARPTIHLPPPKDIT